MNGAGGQRGPQLPHRRVESGCGELRRAINRRDGKSLMMPKYQVKQAPVRDFHALRLSGGSRGVNHVSEIVRQPWTVLTSGGQSRLRDLHLGLDRTAEGRANHAQEPA